MIQALTDFGKRIPKLITDNSPMILTAIGVTGALTTAYLTGIASVKATRLIDERYDHNALELREKVQLTWRLYVPAGASAILTIASIIAANRIGTRRAAALAAAFSLTERAFDEYKTKVVEKLGEKKEESLRAEIAQDRVNRMPPENREIIVTGNGSVLCQDAYSGRYFLSDVETLRKSENDINHQVLHDMYASVSDFYELIGLPTTSISDEVGWNVDKMLNLKLSGTLTEGGNKPCIYVEFTTVPIRGYARLQ